MASYDWRSDDSMRIVKVAEGSLHKWFNASKSKDGKKGWVQSDGSPCANEPGETKTPKCYSSAKRASMSKKELRSADARKAKKDPNQQQKSGAAKPTYVATDKKKKEVDEACWDGYTQKGMKKKGKKVVPNCVKEEDVKGKGSGKKDACYHKVKASSKVWPSAYASGRLVQCRKKGAANYGKSSKKEDFSDWRDDLQLNEIIEKGTKGKIDFHSGKQTTDTGKKTKEGYPISQEKQVMKTKRVTVNNPKGRKRNESPMGKTIGKLNQVKSKQWKAEDKGDTKTAQKMYNRRKKLSGVLYDKTGNFYDRADND